ncbi:hypothetical protein Vafri_2205, partial [Volvox africanus]
PAQRNPSDADAVAGDRNLPLSQMAPLSFALGAVSRATANAAASAAAPAGSETSAATAVDPGEPCVSVSVPLGNHPLDSAVAHVLLEELAEQVLTADIGFTSAANPVRLHRSLVALQASPLELRYMACHTVLLGDPRLADLVPLFVTTATAAAAAAAATTGPGTAHARPPTAAAACTAAAGGGGGGGDPGHIGHTLSATGGGGGASHSRRASRWSLNGGGGGGGGTVNVASNSHSRPGSSSNVPLGAAAAAAAAAAAPRVDSGGAGIRFFALFSRETNSSTGAGGGGGGMSAPNSPQLAVVVRTAGLADAPEAPEPPTRLLSGMQHRHSAQQRRRSSSLGCSAALGAGNAVAKAPELPSMQSCPAAAAAVTSRVSSGVASCLSTPVLLGGYEGGHVAAGPRGQPHPGSAAAAVLMRFTEQNGHAAPSEPTHSQPHSETTTPVNSPLVTLSPSLLHALSPPRSTAAAPPQPDQAPTEALPDDCCPPTDHSAQSTLQLRILVPPVGGAAAITRGSGSGQAASALPPAHSQPAGHRWPFGKGHRRTQSQPVGAPAACNGGALVPPSPRSVPGGAESGVTAVVSAAAQPATAAGTTTLNVLGYHPARISESGGGGSSSRETEAEAEDPAVAAAAAAAAAGALLVTPQRLAQLHAFTAAVQSVATALSKKQRMKEIMSRLLVKYGTCGSLYEEGQGGGQAVAVAVVAGTAA